MAGVGIASWRCSGEKNKDLADREFTFLWRETDNEQVNKYKYTQNARWRSLLNKCLGGDRVLWVEDNITVEGKYQRAKIRFPSWSGSWKDAVAFGSSRHLWCSLFCFHLKLNVWPWVHDIFGAPMYSVVKGEGCTSGSLRPSLDVHFWLCSKWVWCLAVTR